MTSCVHHNSHTSLWPVQQSITSPLLPDTSHTTSTLIFYNTHIYKTQLFAIYVTQHARRLPPWWWYYLSTTISLPSPHRFSTQLVKRLSIKSFSSWKGDAINSNTTIMWLETIKWQETIIKSEVSRTWRILSDTKSDTRDWYCQQKSDV